MTKCHVTAHSGTVTDQSIGLWSSDTLSTTAVCTITLWHRQIDQYCDDTHLIWCISSKGVYYVLCMQEFVRFSEECFNIWESEHHQFWTQMVQILQNSWLWQREMGGVVSWFIYYGNISCPANHSWEILDFFTYWFYSPISLWLVPINWCSIRIWITVHHTPCLGHTTVHID